MKRTNMHIKHFILIALLCAPSLCLYLSFFGHVTPIEIYNCQQLVGHIHTSIDCDQTVCINNFNTDQTQETWITVFVHGIMSIKKHVSLPNIIRLMKDETENTTYAQAVKIMRENPFFFENQAMQQLGLEKIYPTRRERGYASGALASLFDSVVKKSNSTINNHFYTFGWSGLISERSRKSAGEELYHALADEVEKLKDQNVNPKIRVIGYSHGGNVALNLGAVKSKFYLKHPYIVDELILIGTPIQCETDHLVESNVFKHVYNVYSSSDRVQPLDCFSFKRFFSRRTFTSRSAFSVPEKITQIEIRVTDTTKKKKGVPTDLPSPRINPLVALGKTHFLRDRSPGHTELWFFGWTPLYYRKHYPLYPLPTVAFIPHIIKHLKEYKQHIHPEETVIADLRPDYEHMIIRKAKNCNKYMIAPFFSENEIKHMCNYVQAYMPQNYTKDLYDKHTDDAHKLARDYFKDHRKNSSWNTAKLAFVIESK